MVADALPVHVLLSGAKAQRPSFLSDHGTGDSFLLCTDVTGVAVLDVRCPAAARACPPRRPPSRPVAAHAVLWLPARSGGWGAGREGCRARPLLVTAHAAAGWFLSVGSLTPLPPGLCLPHAPHAGRRTAAGHLQRSRDVDV